MKKKLNFKTILSVILTITFTITIFSNLNLIVFAANSVYATGFEASDIQPTWNNSLDLYGNVTGTTCQVVSNEQAKNGIASLKYSGTGTNATLAYAYFNVYSVNIYVMTNTVLDFSIYPLQDNGRYATIDLHCTDGTTLRDSGAVDQNGYSMHPSSGHGGAIPLNSWTNINSNIGKYLAGKTIDKIWVAYSKGTTSTFSGYIDNVNISTPFVTSVESSDIQPTWTNTIDYSSNVSSTSCAVVTGEQSRSGSASIKYSGSDDNSTTSYSYFKVFAVNVTVKPSSILSYSIYPLQDNGRFVGVDFHCTDGTTLRDSGAVDQNGVSMHPAAGHGGSISLNSWTEIRSNIGLVSALVGKTIDKIWIAYDSGPSTGTFSGYIDNIDLNGTLGQNVALNKTATACSYNSALEMPAKAIDGSVNNHWCATDGTGPHWLLVDLGQTYKINEYIVYNAGTGGDLLIANTADFKFQVSNNGIDFIDVDIITDNTSNIVDRTFSSVSARYVKLYITQGEQDGQTAQAARINEFEVYGIPISSKIVTTMYSTEDIVVVDFDTTDYGADNTGVKDSTFAIQQAIDNCYAYGGGTVWLPAGTYKVTNTIYVRPFVTVRGDRRDPDNAGSGYGTIISAQVASGDSGPVLFQIGGSAGVMGLTTYYPNQNINSPVAYNYTFNVPSVAWSGQVGTYMCSSIIDCTMLNSYRGIGVSALDNTSGHENTTIRNVKGTVLYRGAVAYNSADVSTWENVKFNGSYWANAGSSYNAPNITTLNTYTRANATAFTFGDLEWDQFHLLSCSDFNIGINTVAGSRISFCGELTYCTISNTNIGIKVDNIDTRWGMSFLRSTITGSTNAIQNNTTGYVKVCDSTLTGGTTGTVTITTPGTSPTSYTYGTFPKGTRAVLYDVTKSPYNAPYRLPQSGLPTSDATSAIQSALNDASSAGGGVVYVPAGWYKISTHLTVPANVELRGSSSVPSRDQSDLSYGTVLMGYEGQGTANPDTDTAMVTLNGATSGVRGLRFFYPNSNPATGIASFPYTIRANSANCYVDNIGLVNSYNGIDFGTSRCDNHYIRKVIGVAFIKFIKIGLSTQGWIEGSLCSATAVTRVNFGISGWVTSANLFSQVIDPITRVYTILVYSSGGPTNERLLNNFAYGVKIGIQTTAGTLNSFNLGTDNLGSGGYGIVRTGGTIKQMNYMRYNGADSSGTVTFYNKMNL